MWCEPDELGPESVADAVEHGRATGQNYALGKVSSDIHATSGDRPPAQVLETIAANVAQTGLKDQLRRLHADSALHSDLRAIGKRIGLISSRAFLLGSGSLCLIVTSDKADLLLDSRHLGKVYRGRLERVATCLVEECLQVFGDPVPRKHLLLNSVWDQKAFVHGHYVGGIGTQVNTKACVSALRIESHDGRVHDLKSIDI